VVTLLSAVGAPNSCSCPLLHFKTRIPNPFTHDMQCWNEFRIVNKLLIAIVFIAQSCVCCDRYECSRSSSGENSAKRNTFGGWPAATVVDVLHFCRLFFIHMYYLPVVFQNTFLLCSTFTWSFHVWCAQISYLWHRSDWLSVEVCALLKVSENWEKDLPQCVTVNARCDWVI